MLAGPLGVSSGVRVLGGLLQEGKNNPTSYNLTAQSVCRIACLSQVDLILRSTCKQSSTCSAACLQVDQGNYVTSIDIQARRRFITITLTTFSQAEEQALSLKHCQRQRTQ